jgi:hypothetical protein
MVENKSKSMNKPKSKPKSKPKPKSKEKGKEKESKPKPKSNKTTRKSGGGITLIQEVSENNIDQNYERNLNTIIKKMKDQDLINNDGIRFGWNNSSPT